MKTKKWVGLIIGVILPLLCVNGQPPPPPDTSAPPVEPQATAPAPTDLSPAASEVVKLATSGVGEDVILAYVQNSQGGFNLSATHVVYLRDLGVSSDLITAMMNRDASVRTQGAPAQAPPPPPVPQPVEAPLTPPADYVNTPPPTEVNYFYTDLSPYGSWVVLPNYGWCWQPSAVVINRGWRPYCDGGRWIYSDCGWYWHSDYSWGWAPFHYGRWFLHERCGWVWTPDTVWAPAWVTWRVAGDNCGWAPLPPHAYFDVRSGWRFNGVAVSVGFDFGLHAGAFTFVAVKDFTAHDVRHRELPPTQVTKIYNNTTIINNYTVNKNTIVNRGIAVDKVAAATHTQIRTAKVQDVKVTSGHSFAERTFERPGSVVYRPELKAPPKITTAVAQRVDTQHPVIQHKEVIAARTSSSGAISRGNTFGAGNNSTITRTPSPSTRTVTPDTHRNVAPNVERPSTVTPSRTQSAAPTYSPPVRTAPLTPQPSAPAAARPSAEAPKTSSPVTTQAESRPSSTRPPSYYSNQARNEGGPFSSHTSTDARSAPQTPSQSQSPHVYYPKSYYQANEGHSSSTRQSSSSWPGSSSSSGGQGHNKKGDQ